MESYTHMYNAKSILFLRTFLFSNESKSLLNDSILEDNKAAETYRMTIYRYVILFVGLMVLLTNLLVVVSSGLILKRDQQPKTTYTLLGNISLADMLVGLSIVLDKIYPDLTTSDILCIFRTGLLVCSTVTSIYSVGLIAVDRYIYILHGMYYRCWVSTTKVRIGILFTWIIGIILGFLPATGWVNKDKLSGVCSIPGLLPGPLILLFCGVSMLAITVVAILNFIILARALRKIKELKANTTKGKQYAHENNEMTIYRGSNNLSKNPQLVKSSPKNSPIKIIRSISLDSGCDNIDESKNIANVQKYKSNEDFLNVDNPQCNVDDIGNLENVKSKIGVHFDSRVSISTQVSTLSDSNITVIDSEVSKPKVSDIESKTKKISKSKEPNKWRPIIVLTLTSGNLIVTLVPIIIGLTLYVFCKEKLTNRKCLDIRIAVRGPFSTMAIINCILNPIIYAWWHKGFQRSVTFYFRRYILKHFVKNTNR